MGETEWVRARGRGNIVGEKMAIREKIRQYITYGTGDCASDPEP